MAPTPLNAGKSTAALRPAPVVSCFQAELPGLIVEATEEVARTIPAVGQALHAHADSGTHVGELLPLLGRLADPHISREQRSALYEAIGRDAYQRGLSLENLQAAFRVGTQIAWRHFAQFGRQADSPAQQLYEASSDVIAYIDEICTRCIAAYNEAAAQDVLSPKMARVKLLRILISERQSLDEEGLFALARSADWRLPSTVACLVLGEHHFAGHRMGPALDSDVLVDLESDDPCLLVPDPDGPGRLEMIRRGLRGIPFAVGTSVPLAEAAVSFRMARRALALIQRGFLKDAAYVRCAEHLPDMLLLSDEDTARQLVQRRLSVFAGLKQYQCERLKETLEAWLTGGNTTSELAESLSVHPQTVRYRMRKIEEIFGDQLKDPQWRFEMLLALHAERLVNVR
jgi:DNA-binding CsgD family transcriptional regulator